MKLFEFEAKGIFKEFGIPIPQGKDASTPEEVKKISLLGDGTELEWVMTKHGLAIKTPEKTGDHAFVFKIERHHLPPLK